LIRAVLFDLDETLIVDAPITEQALRSASDLAGGAFPHLDRVQLTREARETAQRLWRDSPQAAYCDRIGHSANEGLWARYSTGDHPAIASLREWVSQYRIETWRAPLAAQGVSDPALPRSLAAHFMTARRRFPAFPCIADVLTALRRSGYLLGIVTNGVPDLQREKIAGCGLADQFQAAVVSGEIDCGKPEPGIFRHICRQLGVEPAACVMVGDNPGRDVLGAHNAGMQSVWVQRHGRSRDERYPASLECTDLRALVPWLSQQGAS